MIRIASYNIMSGGFNSYTYDIPKPERLEILQEAIKIINADIIGLIDTFRWDEIFTNEELKRLFGYREVYCINLNNERLRKLGHNNGITVLSNINIEQYKTINLETRDAIYAQIKYGDSFLDIFSVYLDDLSEDTRLIQVKKLFEYINKERSTVIMGDLNTGSAQDTHIVKKTIKQMLISNPQLSSMLYHISDKISRNDVIKLLESKGYKDASKPGDNTVPTGLLPLPVRLTAPILRLDYAFTSPNIKIHNFQVLRDDIFDKASDHYPVVFEID